MNALTWITKEAKHLRRKYPRRFKKWTDYVAQASAIYASKHGGKSPVGKKHKTKKRVGLVEGHKKGTRVKITTPATAPVRYGTPKYQHSVAGIGHHLQAHAIWRTIMKRSLRAKGVDIVNAEIADKELKNLFRKITGRKIPSETAIKKLLKKGYSADIIREKLS